MHALIACPICQHSNTKSLVTRDNVPVHQNMVFQSKEDAARITRGDLHLRLCEECGFIYNSTFDANKLSYGDSYNNSQNYSAAFNQYTEELSQYIIDEKGLQEGTIIEVGCGKADFIRQLFRRNDKIKGYGFDPAYVGDEVEFDGRLKFIRSFYGPAYEQIQADVVVCRHVIEHISHPVELLRTIRKALEHSPNARVYFETPCVKWILENTVIWDFFYEHCSYFSTSSLTRAFEEAGFQIVNIHHVFQGQYLWVEAELNHEYNRKPKGNAATIVPLANEYVRQEARIVNEWEHLVEASLSVGRLAVWGAGAKGVTFCNLFDKNREQIACVIDLNPQKQGGFIPGSGHPIVSPTELQSYSIRNVVLMNPNYREEIEKLLIDNQIQVNILAISEETL
ncbi:methyltransferase domain-containing protein [Cohnella endophytica]|uniref:Methyltransferase domain-containing protein n=1 Tax=Cohnella endophytica TaxID=2419778 RepID=A0A494XGM5_9BACL|nr:class I SAM-dependent methyltransferase [Cohnella endophytica]RKP47234.1 methyltransferase domain-containing protein [Cohnella endophytica]